MNEMRIMNRINKLNDELKKLDNVSPTTQWGDGYLVGIRYRIEDEIKFLKQTLKEAGKGGF
jgi:hypothetical protein